MNLIVKVSATIFAVGGAATAGGYSWHRSKLPTLSGLIMDDEEVTLLSKDSSDEDWKEAWSTYKNSNNAWKLKNSNSVIVPEEFRNTCLNKGNEKVRDANGDEFQNFKKWCSRHYTISEWLKKSNLSLLNDNSDSEKWNKAWGKYKDDPRNKGTNGQGAATSDIWKTSDWGQKSSDSEASPEFKKSCREKSKLKIQNKQDEAYVQVSAWCT